ncbi:S8 family peptidase [Hyalangium rubrum]|uniref:S8 family peptidase n=1 Tax=Hyalangium rubrum TaxID=3103134 RepID=A0ABU5HGG6_9BACT|nr:S8 family peptidase [Hyalangium sp. s54d21]MDY7232252.1 S8 family peptidase [Hyalangium sp. s54d21]
MDVQAEELGESQAPLLMAPSGQGIADAYIVKMKDSAEARSVAALAGVSPRHVYSSLNGFAATLTPAQLTALRRDPNVEYVEQDAVMRPLATQSNPPWGLDRIDQASLPLSLSYTYSSTASNVTAYIIDTGIQANHVNFSGRATNVFDAFGGTGADCNGHGTAIAGIVGSTTYGVAKGVKLRGVRVLDCNGSGTTSGVIAGVDWVRVNHLAPAVATLSLGGAASAALNTAVTNLSNAGVFIAVPAGDSNSNACNFSPAGATAATTVAATDKNDCKTASSNHGTCVDLYAPGALIPTTWSNGGTMTLGGTSTAAAHVTGVGALYKATYGNAASATVDLWIKNTAIAGVVCNNPVGTPNRLLNKGAL